MVALHQTTSMECVMAKRISVCVCLSQTGGCPASTERSATAALWPGASFEWAFSILCEQVSAICICSSHKGLTGQ